MGKIDTAKINGYAEMSVEQKLAALEALEIDAPDYSGYVRKEQFDKTASELSSLKKEYNKKLTDEEIKAKEDAEKQEKLRSDYDALVKKVTISENKAKLLALGYEDKLATETADAMANGELDKVFANQKKHLEAVEKKIRQDILKDTPKPDGGNTGTTITKEQFDAMGYTERLKVFNENPEIYKEYTGGNE